MKHLFFLFVGLILVGNVSAYTFVDIYLDDTGSASFFGGTDEFVSFPKGIELKEGGEIMGETPELTGKVGEVWNFFYSLEGAEINLVLPKGAKIISVESGEISTKNGKIYIYNVGDVDLTYVIEDVQDNLNLWISIGVFIFGFFGFLFYIRRNFKKKIGERNRLVRDILGKRENLILDKLRDTGKIKNSQLRKLCDIPKASFSRNVQELERKGLLKKTGEGKNKFIELI